MQTPGNPKPELQLAQVQYPLQIRELLRLSGYIKAAIQLSNVNKQTAEIANKTSLLDMLLTLFLSNETVVADVVRKYIKPEIIENWLKTGVIYQTGTLMMAGVRFVPYKELIICHEPMQEEDKQNRYRVMNCSGSSQFLDYLTIRKQSKLTLDMGTGVGVLALLAAKHSEKVIAVDINFRALQFARFNAQMNGLTNIQFIQGDMFTALKEQQFDLIFNNPPYVISPDNTKFYRDNPLPGDELLKQTVQDVPRYLCKGGFAQVISDWIQPDNQSWVNRFEGWFKNNHCDNWILRNRDMENSRYIDKWIECDDSSEREKRTRQWLDYFKQHRVASIGFGLITMRRSQTNGSSITIDESMPLITDNAGNHISRSFQVMDYLKNLNKDKDLLKQHIRVSPYLVLNQQSVPQADDTWQIMNAEMHLTNGLQYKAKISREIMDIILLCKHQITLEQVLSKAAKATNKNTAEYIKTCLPIIKEMIRRGVLWPESLRNH